MSPADPRDGLSADQKRALLKEILAKRAAAATPAPAPPAAPALRPDPARRHEPFPLNDMQQAYLLGRSEGVAYGGVPCHTYVEVEAAVPDPARLEAAWNTLVQRVEALRMVLTPGGEQQVLAEVPPVRLEVDELAGLPAAEQEARLQATRARMSTQALDPERWPLFEVRASRLGPDQLRLHLDIDLLFVDALSLMILIEAWGRIARGGPAPEAPGIGLRDYALAEQLHRQGEAHARARAWWASRAAELPPGPELPRPAGPAPVGALTRRLQHRLEPAAWSALRARAAGMGVTPNALLVTLFGDVLGTWSRSPRFTLTLTLFDRQPLHPEVDALLGEFTSTVLLGHDAGGPDLAARARAAQERLAEALDHAACSGVRVLRERNRGLPAGEGLSAPVVFTSLLGLSRGRGGGDAVDALGGLGWGVSATPQVWIDHQVYEDRGALVTQWDLMDGAVADGVVERMFAAYTALLRGPVDAPLALLPADEAVRRAALQDTAGPAPAGWLHTAVEDQAERSPQAVALIAEDRSFTYEELLGAARHVAGALGARGVAPGEPVALVLPRGWAQVVGALGVLIAGGAYLPLEASLPPARIAAVLAQAGARVALVLGDAAPAGAEALSVDRLLEAAAGQPAPPRRPPAQRVDDLAYIIYTSGSTGQPKGVMIDHVGAVNTVQDLNDRLGLGPGDRALGLSALGFDLSVYDIFGPLAVGGALVLLTEASRRDPAAWARAIAAHGVTVWNSVPALAEMLVEHLEQVGQQLPQLRHVLMSGDWIPLGLPPRLTARLPGAAQLSLGGATEGSIWSILHPITGLDPAWPSVPYGRPMRNQQVHVLNAALEPCPELVVGELYLGGIGVARGYWRDPARTAERFIDHPRLGRLYRTGDLGRVHPEGLIEFLGRDDHQVKIRGHRVELGEIEAALLRAPGVSAAVVTATPPPRRRLVGYVVADDAAAVGPPGAPAPEVGEGPGAGAADSAGRRAAVDAALAAGAARGEGAPPAPPGFGAALDALDQLTTAHAGRALQALGLLQPGAPPIDADAALARGGIAPRLRPWVQRTLDALVQLGFARAETGGVVLDGPLEAPPPLPAGAAPPDPELVRVLAYVDRVGPRLPATLRGEAAAADLLFAEGDPTQAEVLYRDWFAESNAVLTEAVRALAAAWPQGRPLRVLEVGAGVGSTTEHLLPVLPADRCPYTFTDVSPYFLRRAEERFGGRPGLQLRLYDLEAPDTAGLPAGAFDLIIGASVVHATADVGVALRGLRRHLAPGGLLLLLEETRFRPAFNLTMGLQSGFDRATDGRVGHPLLSAEAWAAALSAAGFDAPRELPQPRSASAPLGFAVLAARAPARGLDTDALRAHLQALLPAYMVPEHLLPLPALPLSANGKVDRAALPDPDAAPRSARPPYVAPQSDLERHIAEVWRTELGVAEVGRADNFFDLGGDSLLLVRVRAQLAQRTGQEVEMVDLFHHTTVAGLAAHLAARAAAPAGGGLLAEGARRAAHRRGRR